MSRIGRQTIILPAGVTVTIKERTAHVQGPKGELQVAIPPVIVPSQDSEGLHVRRTNEQKQSKALHGLTQRLLLNAVTGVSEGFQKRLEIRGVGMRAIEEDNGLTFSLGFSHPVRLETPEGITLKMEKNTVVVSGIDKQKVGSVAAQIRSFRPVEPYKGKGIRYEGEHVITKQGKAVKSTGA